MKAFLGLFGLLLALLCGPQSVSARNLMCNNPRKTMFFSANVIYFKNNCTLWTTSMNGAY
jgi:hypothetical protein